MCSAAVFRQIKNVNDSVCGIAMVGAYVNGINKIPLILRIIHVSVKKMPSKPYLAMTESIAMYRLYHK